MSEISVWAGSALSEGCGEKPLGASLLASGGFLAIPGLPGLAAEPLQCSHGVLPASLSAYRHLYKDTGGAPTLLH